MLCRSRSGCLNKECSHAVSSNNAAWAQATERQCRLSALIISGQTPGSRACLQAVRYYNAQLPYLSSNPAVSYVFGYDNVLPGAAYLLAEATNFKNASFVHQVIYQQAQRDGSTSVGCTCTVSCAQSHPQQPVLAHVAGPELCCTSLQLLAWDFSAPAAQWLTSDACHADGGFPEVLDQHRGRHLQHRQIRLLGHPQWGPLQCCKRWPAGLDLPQKFGGQGRQVRVLGRVPGQVHARGRPPQHGGGRERLPQAASAQGRVMRRWENAAGPCGASMSCCWLCRAKLSCCLRWIAVMFC